MLIMQNTKLVNFRRVVELIVFNGLHADDLRHRSAPDKLNGADAVANNISKYIVRGFLAQVDGGVSVLGVISHRTPHT